MIPSSALQAGLIFFGVPLPLQPVEGEASSRGKREIRNELSFQASDTLRKKRRSCDEPESLASRIYRTLDGVPRNGQWERGTSKSFGHALNLLKTCTRQKTAAFNWNLSATVFGNQTRYGRENSHVRQ